MKTLVRNPFTLDRDVHSKEHSISFPEPSLTVQADVQQSDINFIVKQFGITHELPYGKQVPAYIDYTDAPTDYHAAMNFVRDTDDVFYKMPAEIRTRFDNDAGQFLDFIRSPDNYEEASKLGLVPPKSPPPVDPPQAPSSEPSSPPPSGVAQSAT